MSGGCEGDWWEFAVVIQEERLQFKFHIYIVIGSTNNEWLKQSK